MGLLNVIDLKTSVAPSVGIEAMNKSTISRDPVFIKVE